MNSDCILQHRLDHIRTFLAILELPGHGICHIGTSSYLAQSSYLVGLEIMINLDYAPP